MKSAKAEQRFGAILYAVRKSEAEGLESIEMANRDSRNEIDNRQISNA